MGPSVTSQSTAAVSSSELFNKAPITMPGLNFSNPESETKGIVDATRKKVEAINTLIAAGVVGIFLYNTEAEAGTIISLGKDPFDVNGNGAIDAFNWGGAGLSGSPSTIAFPIFSGKYSEGQGLSGSFKTVFDAVNTVTGQPLPNPTTIPAFVMEAYIFDTAKFNALSASNMFANQVITLGTFSGELSQFETIGAAYLPAGGNALIKNLTFNTSESILGFVDGQDIHIGIALKQVGGQQTEVNIGTYGVGSYTNVADIFSSVSFFGPGLNFITPAPLSTFNGHAVAAFDIATGPKGPPSSSVPDSGSTGLYAGMLALAFAAYKGYANIKGRFSRT